ncbi:MAG: N-acetylmuramoyl-L-alanine amidase, partial [Deltaproteobacteria bacterium]|nr:N-acetylmuramoyl-L-alanine amidase [Deltaproteobacteria bacterium]
MLLPLLAVLALSFPPVQSVAAAAKAPTAKAPAAKAAASSAPAAKAAASSAPAAKAAASSAADKKPAEDFQTLQKRFDALKEDAKRGLLRENWLRLIEDCSALAAGSGGNLQARSAFLAARALEEMSDRSHSGKDRRRAVEAYAAVAAKYPQADLAPQSLYRQARLLGLILGRSQEAAAVLTVLLRKYPKSQAAKEAGSLKADLAAAAKAPTAAPSGPKAAPEAARKKAPPEAAGKKPAPAAAGKKSAAEAARKKPGPAELPGSARTAQKQSSVMDQLGLNVRTIMLDPGHGGKDPGCVANDLVEKDFTLRMAKIIGALLEKKGFSVLYSRGDDQFISLQDRPDLANKKTADLFISI